MISKRSHFIRFREEAKLSEKSTHLLMRSVTDMQRKATLYSQTTRTIKQVGRIVDCLMHYSLEFERSAYEIQMLAPIQMLGLEWIQTSLQHATSPAELSKAETGDDVWVQLMLCIAQYLPHAPGVVQNESGGPAPVARSLRPDALNNSALSLAKEALKLTVGCFCAPMGPGYIHYSRTRLHILFPVVRVLGRCAVTIMAVDGWRQLWIDGVIALIRIAEVGVSLLRESSSTPGPGPSRSGISRRSRQT